MIPSLGFRDSYDRGARTRQIRPSPALWRRNASNTWAGDTLAGLADTRGRRLGPWDCLYVCGSSLNTSESPNPPRSRTGRRVCSYPEKPLTGYSVLMLNPAEVAKVLTRFSGSFFTARWARLLKSARMCWGTEECRA